MRVNPSFTKKLTMPANVQLGRELAEFSQLAAWAGIKGSAKQARKARGNHYGEYIIDADGGVVEIPVRQFIWAATHNQHKGKYAEEIKRLIAKGIHDNPTPHTQKTEMTFENGNFIVRAVKGSAKHGTPVFAGRSGYKGLMENIAHQMEINQFNAISEVNIVGPKHNSPLTAKRKGFDHPLEDSMEMISALSHGVMLQ